MTTVSGAGAVDSWQRGVRCASLGLLRANVALQLYLAVALLPAASVLVVSAGLLPYSRQWYIACFANDTTPCQ